MSATLLVVVVAVLALPQLIKLVKRWRAERQLATAAPTPRMHGEVNPRRP